MSELLTCAVCGAAYDPASLDAVMYHATEPHRPLPATGIVGERVPDAAPDLVAIRARLAAVTPWPWQTFDARGSGLLPDVVDRDLSHVAACQGHDGMGPMQCRHNAEFISNAPTDVAALLAEVERLRGPGAGDE